MKFTTLLTALAFSVFAAPPEQIHPRGDVDFIKSKIKIIPDFPEKGIMFQDIFPVFQDPLAVEALVSHMVSHIRATFSNKIDVIVGLDARGFLLGPTIALRLGIAFVPVRKQGKLPGKCCTVGYQKEYGGIDYFEMQEGAVKAGQKVIILDDLIATGGSAKAAGDLVKLNGGVVAEYIFFVELCALGGAKKLDAPVYAMIKDEN